MLIGKTMRILATLLLIFTLSCANAATTQYGAPKPGSPGTSSTSATAQTSSTSTAALSFMPQMTQIEIIKALFEKAGYKYFHKNKPLKLFTIPEGE